MKRFKTIFIAIFAVLLTNLTTTATAQDTDVAWLDSVDISLLTCGPGQEVWSYYGHTALRINDKAHHQDLAVNWGMFSFQQDYFVLRFVFGLTDYQMGIMSMDSFMEEYRHEGRWVLQQHLALTRQEKSAILSAVWENSSPEKRTYRYNFFYDNCTTRARDMITSHMGKLSYTKEYPAEPTTYRKEIHSFNKNHRWARFGNDLLLGVCADSQIDRNEWEFLPVNLSMEFASAKRTDAPGTPLVSSTSYLISPTSVFVSAPTELEDTLSITPRCLFLVIGIVIMLLSGMESWRKKRLWWVDTILLLITGFPGLILLSMAFSQHPTVQINFQILLLNPLNLVFVWSVTKKARKGGIHWYYHLWGAMLFAALLAQLWQDYAEGMGILALSLLIRYTTVAIRHK